MTDPRDNKTTIEQSRGPTQGFNGENPTRCTPLIFIPRAADNTGLAIAYEDPTIRQSEWSETMLGNGGIR